MLWIGWLSVSLSRSGIQHQLPIWTKPPVAFLRPWAMMSGREGTALAERRFETGRSSLVGPGIMPRQSPAPGSLLHGKIV